MADEPDDVDLGELVGDSDEPPADADDVDLGELLAGGGEDRAEEEPTVQRLIELGEDAGFDLSFLARAREADIPIALEELSELEAQVRLLQAIRQQLSGVPAETAPWRVAQFPADPTRTIATTTELRETQTINAGIVQRITADYRNTQDLVDLRVEIDGDRVVPVDDADGDWATHHQDDKEWFVGYEAFGEVDVVVIWRNRDNTNTHRVPVDLEYTGA